MESNAQEVILTEGLALGRPTGNGHYVFGSSPAMRALERVIHDIAPTDIPVLLLGESGTGKEVVALEIHRRSLRGEQPFVKISCATLSPAQINGRFPAGSSAGHFAGTLFLDEIADLDPECQARLLHALPDGNATNGHGGGARVICSSGRNLEELMRAGRLREELYYRINGVCLRLPPLRHCKADIPALVDFFLHKYTDLFGRPQMMLSARARRVLQEHAWPGNVRELENTVKKIVALGDEQTAVGELERNGSPEHSKPENGKGISLKEAARAASRQAERELILKVLTRTRWNRKRAAQELQISYKALLYKLKQIGLNDAVSS